MRRIAQWIGGAFVVLTTLFFLLVYWRHWNPSPFDVGPLTGVQHQVPIGDAVQSFPIWAGRRLLVYPRNERELAPVVVLQDSTGRTAWAIEARGDRDCRVNSVRFDSYSRVPWLWPRVVGKVNWNCGGYEQTVWKLGRDGSLKEYWYSW